MEENKKTKNIKLTLYITLILCLMVGVSYATYNLVLKGNKQHQINIGSLTLTYEETNNINVTGDTIKTDEEGIASGNVFNFKVSVNNTTNKEINYIVYLTMDIEYLNNIDKGKVYLNNVDITNLSIRKRNKVGLAHIPEDRHRHGLVLDYSLEQNLVLQNYFEDRFQKAGFIKFKNIRKYADDLIEKFDIRSGQGSITVARSMSGGNQQKAIVAREIDRNTDLLIAVQPTRGLDVGAIENIHSRLVELRDADKAVLLVSLELDEVMSLSDRILVMHKGEIVGEFNPKEVTAQELGLYMAGAKKQNINKVGNNNE